MKVRVAAQSKTLTNVDHMFRCCQLLAETNSKFFLLQNLSSLSKFARNNLETQALQAHSGSLCTWQTAYRSTNYATENEMRAAEVAVEPIRGLFRRVFSTILFQAICCRILTLSSSTTCRMWLAVRKSKISPPILRVSQLKLEGAFKAIGRFVMTRGMRRQFFNAEYIEH